MEEMRHLMRLQQMKHIQEGEIIPYHHLLVPKTKTIL